MAGAATPEERLAELGLALPEVTAPLAAYVPAVRTGDHVYTSGQLPLVDGRLVAVGKVGVVGVDAGAEVSPDDAHAAAQVCALNALAALRAVVGDLAAVVRVVKVVGFVASAPTFTGQPAVINGASNLLGDVFGGGSGDAGTHARSAVGVAALPLDAPVEVEMIFEVRAD